MPFCRMLSECTNMFKGSSRVKNTEELDNLKLHELGLYQQTRPDNS